MLVKIEHGCMRLKGLRITAEALRARRCGIKDGGEYVVTWMEVKFTSFLLLPL